MAQGIILAAGYSSRAKTNKMLWVYKDRFLICHAIDSMLPFVSTIFVITGNNPKDIEKAVPKDPKIKLVHNDHFAQGMFTSIKTGVYNSDEDVFILPGDCPFVSPNTYKKMLEGTKDIRVPRYLGTTGHPLFMKATLKKELLAEPSTSNLKAFRNRLGYEVIKVDDPNVLMDLDTPADYEALSKLDGKDTKHGV